ncbi:MAG: hypothetical protein ABI346_02350 [Candidatus Baltobacteraceae bacterium]
MTPAQVSFLGAVAAIALVLVACGSGPGSSGCSSPPPVPIPELFLSYPEPGSPAVSVGIGEVIFVGNAGGLYAPDTVAIRGRSGANVPVGAFTAAPSPFPTPYAVPSGFSGNIPFVAVPIPTLSPGVTYDVSFSYTDWADAPPACRTTVTQSLGSFTTK